MERRPAALAKLFCAIPTSKKRIAPGLFRLRKASQAALSNAKGYRRPIATHATAMICEHLINEEGQVGLERCFRGSKGRRWDCSGFFRRYSQTACWGPGRASAERRVCVVQRQTWGCGTKLPDYTALHDDGGQRSASKF